MGVAMAAITISVAPIQPTMVGDADEREQPRGAAAVNSMLDGFVESVPRRSEAADHQAEYQQKRST